MALETVNPTPVMDDTGLINERMQLASNMDDVDLEEGEIEDDEEDQEKTPRDKRKEDKKRKRKRKNSSPKDQKDPKVRRKSKKDGEKGRRDGTKKSDKDRREGHKRNEKEDERKPEPEKPLEKKSKEKKAASKDELEEDEMMLFVRGASPPPKMSDDEEDEPKNESPPKINLMMNNMRDPIFGPFGQGMSPQQGFGSDEEGDSDGSGRGALQGRGGDSWSPRSRYLNKRRVVPCKYFAEGKCHKGSTCHYQHDISTNRKLELCKFYLNDCCVKRDKCLYMHKDFPCKFFHTGTKCFQGDKCKFSHDNLSDTTRTVLLKHLETAPKDILGDFPRLSKDVSDVIVGKDKSPKKGSGDRKIPSLFEIDVKPPAGLLKKMKDRDDEDAENKKRDSSSPADRKKHRREAEDNGARRRRRYSGSPSFRRDQRAGSNTHQDSSPDQEKRRDHEQQRKRRWDSPPRRSSTPQSPYRNRADRSRGRASPRGRNRNHMRGRRQNSGSPMRRDMGQSAEPNEKRRRRDGNNGWRDPDRYSKDGDNHERSRDRRNRPGRMDDSRRKDDIRRRDERRDRRIDDRREFRPERDRNRESSRERQDKEKGADESYKFSCDLKIDIEPKMTSTEEPKPPEMSASRIALDEFEDSDNELVIADEKDCALNSESPDSENEYSITEESQEEGSRKEEQMSVRSQKNEVENKQPSEEKQQNERQVQLQTEQRLLETQEDSESQQVKQFHYEVEEFQAEEKYPKAEEKAGTEQSLNEPFREEQIVKSYTPPPPPELDALSNLPKPQRQLYLRIQQQQQHKEAHKEEVADEKMDKEISPLVLDEDYYSSDEEGRSCLQDIIKKVKEAVQPPVSTTPPLPPPPQQQPVSLPLDITKMLSQLREQASKTIADQDSCRSPKQSETSIRQQYTSRMLEAPLHRANSPRSLQMEANVIRKEDHISTKVLDSASPRSFDDFQIDPLLQDLRPRTSYGSANHSGSNSPPTLEDVDLDNLNVKNPLNLPFKPILHHAPCKIMDGSSMAKPPMRYKVYRVYRVKPDYTRIKIELAGNAQQNDPRLKNMIARRRSSSDSEKDAEHMVSRRRSSEDSVCSDIKSPPPTLDSRSVIDPRVHRALVEAAHRPDPRLRKATDPRINRFPDNYCPSPDISNPAPPKQADPRLARESTSMDPRLRAQRTVSLPNEIIDSNQINLEPPVISDPRMRDPRMKRQDPRMMQEPPLPASFPTGLASPFADFSEMPPSPFINQPPPPPPPPEDPRQRNSGVINDPRNRFHPKDYRARPDPRNRDFNPWNCQDGNQDIMEVFPGGPGSVGDVGVPVASEFRDPRVRNFQSDPRGDPRDSRNPGENIRDPRSRNFPEDPRNRHIEDNSQDSRVRNNFGNSRPKNNRPSEDRADPRNRNYSQEPFDPRQSRFQEQDGPRDPRRLGKEQERSPEYHSPSYDYDNPDDYSSGDESDRYQDYEDRRGWRDRGKRSRGGNRGFSRGGRGRFQRGGRGRPFRRDRDDWDRRDRRPPENKEKSSKQEKENEPSQNQNEGPDGPLRDMFLHKDPTASPFC